MPTTDERDGAGRAADAGADARKPARDEAARARAYLDLWERHLTQSAVDGPIQAGSRPPA
jgi:hypothetical protein